MASCQPAELKGNTKPKVLMEHQIEHHSEYDRRIISSPFITHTSNFHIQSSLLKVQ